VKKTRDASDRHLPPNRTACTRTSCVPGSLSPLSQRGNPVENKAPRGNYQGTGRFTTPKTASADRRYSATLEPYRQLRPGERTWAFSSHGTAAIEPLTPLSRFPRSSHGSRLREIHRRDRKPPRPPPSPTRESLRRILIRSAFHRQGLFVGFGGHYSPGPATTTPLLAMV